MLTISPDGKSFDLDLSNVDFSSSQRLQVSPIRAPMYLVLPCVTSLPSPITRVQLDWVYRNATSGGEGTSTIIARIHIIKGEWARPTPSLRAQSLGNQHHRPGQTWTITTLVRTVPLPRKLPAGTYGVQEITAPTGYQLNMIRTTSPFLHLPALLRPLRTRRC